MLLEAQAHYNNLSTELRDELNEKINGFGKRVRYRFHIEKDNPDPTKYDGEKIFPSVYTLDPCVFDIFDEKAKKGAKVAIVDSVDEKGLPNRFRKVRIKATQRGILDLELSRGSEGRDIAMYIELHPKLANGKFVDPEKVSVITRIDEVAEATKQSAERTARRKALNVAGEMDDKAILNFADAMLWDSTVDPKVLRNMVEDLADTNPEFFNDLVSGKSVQYRALVKQALDRKIIEFDPAEYKIKWAGNQQTITMLSPNGEGSHVEKAAEWFQVGGVKAEEAYKKIESLLK